MKISKREKNLLLFLGTLVIFYGYYNFIFLSQRETITNLKENKAQAEEKYNHMEKIIYSIDSMKSHVEESKKLISEKTEKLYPYLQQNILLVEVDKLLRESGIQGSMSFTQSTFEVISSIGLNEEASSGSVLKPVVDSYKGIKEVDNSPEESKGENPTVQEDSTVEAMKINLSFSGSYDSFIKLLTAFEKHEKRIFVSGLTIAQSTAEEITGTAVLSFYSIPKITDEDVDYGRLESSSAYGKENPFTGGAVPSFSRTIEESAQNIEEKYDFALGLKSFSSDIPTFMLGKAEDSSKSTYIYDDSEDQIEAEVIFSENNGEYYYKYKTKAGSYPLNYVDLGEVFKPLGNKIIIKVFSSERLGDMDKSSAKLKVVNNTDKAVIVYIKDDPTDNPRISVLGDGGNVDIKRE